MKHSLLMAAMLSTVCAHTALAEVNYKLFKSVGTLQVTPSADNPNTPNPQASMTFNEAESRIEAFANENVQKSFTLTNNSTDPVKELVMAVNKGSILNTSCGAVLPVGQSCIISVEYSGADTGSAPITLTASGKTGTKASTATSNLAVARIPALQRLQLQNANPVKLTGLIGTKATASFNVYNPNPYSVNISAPSYPAGGLGPATTCGTVLGANATCTIALEATPVAVGTVSSSVQITATKRDALDSVSSAVAIEGVDPYAGYLRVRFDFENGTTMNTLPSARPDFYMAGTNGAIIITTPEGNRVASFNGFNSIANLPSTLPTSFLGDFTVAFDVKFNVVGTVTSDNTPSNQYLFSMGGNDTRIQWYKGDDIGLRFITAGTVVAQKRMDPVVGKWYHVSFTRKNNILTSTWDGEVLASVYRPGPLGDPSSMVFGNYIYTNYGLNGEMDNIIVADYAL